jgi:hypothetical protein
MITFHPVPSAMSIYLPENIWRKEDEFQPT